MVHPMHPILASVTLFAISLLSLSVAPSKGTNIYNVKNADNLTIGRIQLAAKFIFSPQSIISMPDANVTVVGVPSDSKIKVTFQWAKSTFVLDFEEVDGNAHLQTAMAKIGEDSATWILKKDLFSSKNSYECNSIFALSEKIGNAVEAKLILEDVRIQVFNFKSTFSDAIVCPEDLKNPVKGSWTLSQDNSHPCIRLDGAFIFNITYLNTMKQPQWTTVNLPPSAVVLPHESFCATKDKDVNTTLEQELSLGFYNDWKFVIHFTRDVNVTKDKQADHWMVDWVVFELTFENFHFPQTLHQNRQTYKSNITQPLGLFRTMNDRSYLCNAVQEKVITENLILSTQTVQVQPFMYSTEYLAGELCAADMMVSDVVPIIIGAALAILIVVVLVAYLIGRAKTRRQTYENI